MFEESIFPLSTRRTFLLGLAQAALLGGLVVPLYRLQVKKQSRYLALSENNRLTVHLTNPIRGRLFDRHGIPLAFNKNIFRLAVLPATQEELLYTLKSLQRVMPQYDFCLESVLRTFQKNPHALLVLKKFLTWDEVVLLEMHASYLPGVQIEGGQTRHYALGGKAVHFLGYVGCPIKGDTLSKNQSAIPHLRIGRAGVEKVLDSQMRGQEGSVSLEINAHRRVVRTLDKNSSVPGSDQTVSLDSRLQHYVASRLSEHKSASAVVMDPQGEIHALVSHPGFDPHLFVNGVKSSDWKNLHERAYNPLLNKALNGLYPPASTIKMAIVLAALTKGVITPKTRFHCAGFVSCGNRPLHCWRHKTGGHGSLNCYQAIVQSCDVFLYEIARRTGAEFMSQTLRELGLGERLMPDFQEEVAGLVPTPTWKRASRNASWTPADSMLMGIGQGYMLATPLQLAVMTARLMTGQQVMPRYLSTEKHPSPQALSFAPEHLELIRESMIGVTNTPQGTSFRYRISKPGFEMAGKTGTSQVRRISLSDRKKGLIKTAHLPWEEREHALFCGYAPIHHPRYAIGLIIEHGGGGGSVATPVARDILHYAQEL